jgi:hypothetical protein
MTKNDQKNFIVKKELAKKEHLGSNEVPKRIIIEDKS